MKYAPHLEAALKQKTAKKGKDLCLDHFDIYYKKNFEKIWPSLRLALLSRPKFCALVNNYGDPETAAKRLIDMGCYSIRKKHSESCEKYNSISNEAPFRFNNMVESTPNSVDTLPPTYKSENLRTLTPEEAADRIILPQEMILQGGGSDIDAASASMYDFVPSTKIKGMEDFVEDSEYYDKFNNRKGPNTAMPVEIKEHSLITFPTHLEAYTFATGATDMRLEPPEKGILGTFDYYCMDLASLLPVLSLDIQRGQSVLDMCAAPGGKTLAMLQVICATRRIPMFCSMNHFGYKIDPYALSTIFAYEL